MIALCKVTSRLTLAAALLSAGAAQAQVPTPEQLNSKYVYAKKEDTKGKVDWKASASAGLTLASGNSSQISISAGANVMRNDGLNKVELNVNGAYASTNQAVIFDGNGNGIVDSAGELGSQSKTTAGFVLAKLRYDRFFTPNNSAYLAGYAGVDIPASKRANVGGQLGYARQLFKEAMHDMSAELGLDYNYVGYIPVDGVAVAGTNNDLHLASARLFVGYNLAIGANTQFKAGYEALINLNTNSVSDRYVRTADATRMGGTLALTTKVWNRLSFRFSTSLRYDNCPALNTQVKFKGLGFALPTDVTCSSLENYIQEDIAKPIGTAGKQGFSNDDLGLYRIRYNQKFDTLTEASLVFTFL